MVQTLKLGSLYLDGESIAPEAKYQPGQIVSFGEAAPNMAISWVPVNGMLIADRCLLTHISWDDLDAQSLVFGKEVTAQGFKFKIRLLKVGSEEDVPNEWGEALDTVGDNNTLWHWKDEFFWGQESVSEVALLRAYRGYDSARYLYWDRSSFRYANLGFRPALIPLFVDSSALSPGQEILVMGYGYDGCVVGELMDITKYDLILQPKPGGLVGETAFAAIMRDGTVAVDRDKILSITAAYS